MILRCTYPVLLSLTIALSGCADLPDVAATLSPASRAADFPDLVPLAPLLAGLPPPGEAPVIPQGRAASSLRPADLDARTERLKSRAEALRNAPV